MKQYFQNLAKRFLFVCFGFFGFLFVFALYLLFCPKAFFPYWKRTYNIVFIQKNGLSYSCTLQALGILFHLVCFNLFGQFAYSCIGIEKEAVQNETHFMWKQLSLQTKKPFHCLSSRLIHLSPTLISGLWLCFSVHSSPSHLFYVSKSQSIYVSELRAHKSEEFCTWVTSPSLGCAGWNILVLQDINFIFTMGSSYAHQ